MVRTEKQRLSRAYRAIARFVSPLAADRRRIAFNAASGPLSALRRFDLGQTA
jgi:hypothetical protein